MAPTQFQPGTQGKKAQEEALALQSGVDLAEEAKKRGHGRDQKFKDHLNVAALAIFWCVIACVAWGVVAYGWHLLMPEPWHYLSKEQLNKIESILAAAILSSALTGYASKRMD
jgi:hypothetical protein